MRVVYLDNVSKRKSIIIHFFEKLVPVVAYPSPGQLTSDSTVTNACNHRANVWCLNLCLSSKIVKKLNNESNYFSHLFKKKKQRKQYFIVYEYIPKVCNSKF